MLFEMILSHAFSSITHILDYAGFILLTCILAGRKLEHYHSRPGQQQDYCTIHLMHVHDKEMFMMCNFHCIKMFSKFSPKIVNQSYNSVSIHQLYGLFFIERKKLRVSFKVKNRSDPEWFS